MFIEHLALKMDTVIHTSNRLMSPSLLRRSIENSHCDFVLMFNFETNVHAEIRSSTGISYCEPSFCPFILDYLCSALQPK